MGLKSYRLKPKKRKKRTGNIIGSGISALLGVALFSETASAVRRI